MRVRYRNFVSTCHSKEIVRCRLSWLARTAAANLRYSPSSSTRSSASSSRPTSRPRSNATRSTEWRSAQFIRRGACWYHAKLQFDGGLALDEWTLDRPRKQFEEQVSPLPDDDGWKKMPEDKFNHFALTPEPSHPFQRVLSRPIQNLFGQNVVLFFPSDRFELPDWLNDQALAGELRFPEPNRFEGHTPRRIFSRALLKPTLEWVKAVVLDNLLQELSSPRPVQFVPNVGLVAMPVVQGQGKDGKIIEFVGKVLARILGADGDSVQFRVSHRNMGTITVEYVRSERAEAVPSLLGLSAGQAALFCVFSNLIRDFDLGAAKK